MNAITNNETNAVVEATVQQATLSPRDARIAEMKAKLDGLKGKPVVQGAPSNLNWKVAVGISLDVVEEVITTAPAKVTGTWSEINEARLARKCQRRGL